MADKRTELLDAARSFGGLPYRLDPPPDGVTTIDCSLLIVKAAQKAGIPLPPGVRTAEQIRWASFPIDWDDVKPGDLLFFENTYDAGPPGPDGHIASHIGLSLGAGTKRMIDAHQRAGGATAETDISTAYWQDKLFEARRLPALAVAEPAPPPGELTSEPDHLFSFEELWPTIKSAGNEFGFDPQVLAGIMKQESGFRNWRVHRDGTGHGLLGLDDNGMLPGFEGWSGISVGRGHNAVSIPIVPQIRYAAFALADYARRLGGPYAAARAWHRGQGQMNDSLGQNYERLIRAHVATLFAGGEPSIPVPAPVPPPPPSGSSFSVGEGILNAMKAAGSSPSSNELFFKRGTEDEWSEAFDQQGRRYIWLPRVGRVFRYDPAA